MGPVKHNRRKKARFSPPSSDAGVTSEDFGLQHAPHPYGILPAGNRYFADKTTVSTSSPLHLLTEECWSNVFSFCDGTDLSRTSQTCRFFYVASHQPELWRDIVLQMQDTIDSFGASWKDLYVSKVAKQSYLQSHKPITVAGVYSDFYFRLHACRSFAIPQSWLDGEKGNLPIVPVENITTETFLEKFERPNAPVVIQGAAATWQAFAKWNDPDYLQRHTMGRSFRATSGVAQLPAQFTLKAYYEYCGINNTEEADRLLEEGPLYLFDRNALEPGSTLWKDFMADLQRTCPFWDSQDDLSIATGHDLFQILGEGRRPDHTWLIVGPKRSGSVFHIDPNGTHAWNATICGRKRWIFYPPGVTPPGIHPSEDGDEVALPISIGEWLFQFWDEHCERTRTAPAHERPLECTAMPGDVVFVPHGWWHMVINLDEVNIAITHNYVSASNLSNVLKFLGTKRDQVSGCRDRSESVKPDHLYEEFVETMKMRHPKLLEQALAVPDWTCRAWNTKEDKREKKIDEHTTPGFNGQMPLRTNLMDKARSGGESAPFRFSFAPTLK